MCLLIVDWQLEFVVWLDVVVSNEYCVGKCFDGCVLIVNWMIGRVAIEGRNEG